MAVKMSVVVISSIHVAFVGSAFGVTCVRESVIKKVFSVCSLCGSRRCTDVAECSVVDLESSQPTIQAFLHIREMDMVSESNSGTSSSVVNVRYNVKTRQDKLLIFNLLHTKNVQVHSPCECAKGLSFGGVGNCVDIDSCNIVAGVISHF